MFFIAQRRSGAADNVHENFYSRGSTMYGKAAKRLFDQGTRRIHWLNAALMLAAFALAFSIDIATSRATHTAILQFHRLVGLTIWLLTLVRLAWRMNVKYPDWPNDMSAAMRAVAKSTEYGLYALLFLQPILGLLQTNAHGNRVDLFFAQLPALIGKNRFLADQLLLAHKAVGFSLLALIALHVSAALYHHFVRRDDILTAMLPASAAWRKQRPLADLHRGGSLKGARGR
jgi:superoxide oxidase